MNTGSAEEDYFIEVWAKRISKTFLQNISPIPTNSSWRKVDQYFSKQHKLAWYLPSSFNIEHSFKFNFHKLQLQHISWKQESREGWSMSCFQKKIHWHFLLFSAFLALAILPWHEKFMINAARDHHELRHRLAGQKLECTKSSRFWPIFSPSTM